MTRWAISVSIATALAAFTLACSGSNSSPGAPTPTPTPTPTVSSVTVTGPAPSIGLTAQLTATATLSNGSTQNVTSTAAWQSSNSSVATVSASGVVTGVGAGDADVTATYQNVSGRMRLTLTRSTYTLTGTVRDGTSGGVLPGIVVVVQDGVNAGKGATTSNAGTYSISDLLAGSFTLAAAATGYQTTTKPVSLSGNMGLDFVLPRNSPTPTPTPSPSTPTCNGASVPPIVDCLNNQGFQPPTARCNDGAFSCSQNRQGTCSSHGGVSCYVCPGPIC